MSVESDLIEGLAQMAATNGLGTYLDPSSANPAYQPGQTAIVFGKLIEAVDRVIAIDMLPASDDIILPMGTVIITFLIRGNPDDILDTLNLSSQLRDVFHGTTNLVFGSATVVQMNRYRSTDVGEDDSNRYVRGDMYLLDVAFPPTVNRP
jgi:hypothetical protein